MTGSHQPERVYALLVEANPVPDPALAREMIDRRRGHLTLVEPRRRDMMERPEIPNRPRWMVPALAAAVVTLFVGGLMLFTGNSDEDDVVATTAAPTTTVAPATTTTAAPTTTVAPATTAAPAPTTSPQTFEARIVADNDVCTYEGPETIGLGDVLELTLVNTTEQHVFVEVYRFLGEGSVDDLPGLAATPELVWGQPTVHSFGVLHVYLYAGPDSENSNYYDDVTSNAAVEDPLTFERVGGYGFICFSGPGRTAPFESGAAASSGFTVEG
jgi:hypothetical protein